MGTDDQNATSGATGKERAPRLVLASTSPYRRSLLQRLGVPFEAVAPRFDEEAAKERLGPACPPAELCRALADGKARAAAKEVPDAFVLGADQLAALGASMLGKPGNVAGACAQLEALTGRTHTLHTAFTVIAPGGRLVRHLDTTRLTMRKLSPERIATYVELDHPTDCAGSYRIEEHGIALFERIETEDATAIEGLPLLAASRILRDLGFSFP